MFFVPGSQVVFHLILIFGLCQEIFLNAQLGSLQTKAGVEYLKYFVPKDYYEMLRVDEFCWPGNDHGCQKDLINLSEFAK